MNTFKNYLIGGLSALLLLSLSMQSAHGGGASKEAKTVQYSQCFTFILDSQNWKYGSIPFKGFEDLIKTCDKYKP